MIFQTLGLDIAIVLIGLNVLTIITFLIKSCNLEKKPQEQQKKIKKAKNQTDEGQQTKITVNNQTSTMKKNGSTFKNLQPNETDQTNRLRIQMEHHPQQSGLMFSPSHKNNENDNLMPSSTRQTQRVSIVPILQTQIQHTNTKSPLSQNNILDSKKQQQDLNKSIINQLKDNTSFVHSNIVQCKQCRADESVEQSDDIVTIERKRNMSIPSELKDCMPQNETKEQILISSHEILKQELRKKFIYSQNTYLLLSSLFFTQILMLKVNEESNFYAHRNINDSLKVYLTTSCFGAAFFNIFYSFIILFLEKILKCNDILVRILFFAYNISIPFYIMTNIQVIEEDLNLEFLVILGFNFLVQILLSSLLNISNIKFILQIF